MVRRQLLFSAVLENVARIEPPRTWVVDIACGACDERHAAVVLDADEKTAIPGSRGEAHLVLRCRGCRRELNATIDEPSMAAYQGSNAEDNETELADAPQAQCVAVIEVRGGDIVGWVPRGEWTVVSRGKGAMRISNVDFEAEPDWCEYDEAAALPLSVCEVVATVGAK